MYKLMLDGVKRKLNFMVQVKKKKQKLKLIKQRLSCPKMMILRLEYHGEEMVNILYVLQLAMKVIIFYKIVMFELLNLLII